MEYISIYFLKLHTHVHVSLNKTDKLRLFSFYILLICVQEFSSLDFNVQKFVGCDRFQIVSYFQILFFVIIVIRLSRDTIDPR